MIGALLVHLGYILAHKLVIGYVLFRANLYKQIFTHDLSKFTLCELAGGAKYVYRRTGKSRYRRGDYPKRPTSWFAHRKINSHHPEFWLDGGNTPTIMPFQCALEMVCDMIASNRGFRKKKYWDYSKPLKYWETHQKNATVIHPHTKLFAGEMLTKFSKHGYSGLNKKLAFNIYREIKEDFSRGTTIMRQANN
jgi:hypothetical protein